MLSRGSRVTSFSALRTLTEVPVSSHQSECCPRVSQRSGIRRDVLYSVPIGMEHQRSLSLDEEVGLGTGKGMLLRLEFRSRSETEQGYAGPSQRVFGSETENLELIQTQKRALRLKWGHDTGDLE